MSLQYLTYQVGRTFVDLYTRLALGMDVEYHAALPAGPKILAANHPTTTDPFFLMTIVPEQVSILVTGLAFDVPVFGDYLQAAQHIPVRAQEGRLAFQEAERQLLSGRTIGIFPEGALSPLAGGLGFHEPHTGAVRLALSTGAPIVPVGVYLDPARIRCSEVQAGDQSDAARWYPSGPYAVTVGKAMYLDGVLDDRAYVRSASLQVMQHIAYLARQSDQRIRANVLPLKPRFRFLGIARLWGKPNLVPPT
jgi:1-acyl-sn-glycerol-3-phosphate acyltransferase